MAPESRDEVPHRDEVRQRINSLYDQAEDATGNYNATRARALVTRSRGVPLAKRSGRRPDPVLDEVARPWFDGARAKLGPTVPAVLPADRLEPPAATRRFRDRMGGGLPGGAPDALGLGPSARRPDALERAAERTIAELSAGRATDPESLALAARESARAALSGPRRPELPSGNTDLTGPGGAVRADGSTAELSASGPTALAAPDTRTVPAGLVPVEPGGLGPVGQSGLGTAPPTDLGRALPAGLGAAQPAALYTAQPAGLGPAETAVLPLTSATLPTAQGAPVQGPRTLLGATAPGRPSPATSKGNNQRKLAAASDVLSRYTAQLTTYAAAVQAMTVQAAPVADIPSTPGTVAPPTPLTPTPPAPPTTDQWPQSRWATPDATATTPPTAETPRTHTPSMTGTGTLTPVPESAQATRADKAIAFARAQIGKPCVWGATGPDSYDCSSLTQAAWKAAGVTLPRAAHQQALAGVPVTLAGIEPGDLVLFFGDDRHVGLHVGGGMMVHAPGPGSAVREESIYGAGESAIHRIVRPA